MSALDPLVASFTPRRRSALLRLVAAAASTALLVACGGGDDDTSEEARRNEAQPTPSTQMQAVLTELAALGAKPVETLTVAQARTQPSPADAVRSLLVKQGRSPAPEAVASVVDRVIAGPAGPLAIRIYTPAGTGPFPVILYIHGGGWVIATIDTYDGSARALANAAGAIVVSTEYRKGPEDRFPAAHDDTYAAWQWTVANTVAIGGIARQVAVVGESAGGNMAASIAIRSRDAGIQQPVHQGLVYPVADVRLDKPSHDQNRAAMPLSTAGLAWFYERYLATPADGDNPRIAILRAPDVRGTAPATVISADIDPLRSEGRFYAEKLREAGVDTEWTLYSGVTHEFFGLGAVVDTARDAQARLAARLKASFAVPR